MQKRRGIVRALSSCVRRLMFLWVRTVVHGTLPHKAPSSGGTILVYALKNRSYSDLRVIEQICLDQGLPAPCRAAHIGQAKEVLTFFSLSKVHGLLLPRQGGYSSSRLQDLVQAVFEGRLADVAIVPVQVSWGRRPDRENSPLKLLFPWNYNVGSRLKKFLAILLHGRNVMVHFNAPLSVRQTLDEGLDLARLTRKIHRILRVHFRQLHTSVNGPDLSHRHMLVNTILQSEAVRNAVQSEVKAGRKNSVKVERRASKYINEIASDYSSSAVRLLDLLLTWFWNKFYGGVQVNNIVGVQELAKDHEIIYLPCHRSHIDYLLLPYVLFHNGLQTPHIAAGINLNMPFVGSILRRCGAFYIRRSFKGDALYSTVFHQYLHTLFVRGFPVCFFIEGGRSRTGRILNPRTGLLSIMLRSYARNHQKPIAVVPVYIGYEKVLEASTYIGELQGKKKKKESPMDLLRTVVALKGHMGRTTVNFARPIKLDTLLDSHCPQWRNSEAQSSARPDWLSSATDHLARIVAESINNATVINAISIIASILLATPRQAMGENELVEVIDIVNRLLKQVPYSSTVTHSALDGRQMLAQAEKLQMVRRRRDSLGELIFLDQTNAVLMTYYRNNILHVMAIPAFICSLFVYSEQLAVREVIDFCRSFYPYLKAELFLRWDLDELENQVHQWLAALQEQGLIFRQGQYLLRTDPQSIEFISLMVLSRVMQHSLERFTIVVSLLLSNGSGHIHARELEKQSRDMAQRLSGLYGLNAPEFFDKSLFSQFIRQLQAHNVLTVNSDKKLSFGEPIKYMAEQVQRLLPLEMRYGIGQVTSTSRLTSATDLKERQTRTLPETSTQIRKSRKEG